MILKLDNYVKFYLVFSGIKNLLEEYEKDPRVGADYVDDTFYDDKETLKILLQELQDKSHALYKIAQEEYNDKYGYKFRLN